MARTPQDLSSRVMRLILWPALGFGPSGAGFALWRAFFTIPLYLAAIRGPPHVPDVFISYSKLDREEAARLAADLQWRGLDVWWDTNLYASCPTSAPVRQT
jgi:hypothetical protein